MATDASDAWGGVRQGAEANGHPMGAHPDHRDAGAEKLADQAPDVRVRAASEHQVVRWLAERRDAVPALCKPDVVQSAA